MSPVKPIKPAEKQLTIVPARVCKICKKEKPLRWEFFQSAGRGAFLWTCRMCYNKKNKKYLKKKRAKPIPKENYIPPENDGTRFRICTGCKKELLETIDNFGWRPRDYAFRSKCKECEVLAAQDYAKRNRYKITKRSRKYTDENRELINQRRQERRKKYKITGIGGDYFIAKYKTYANKLTIEESPKRDENGYLLVKCTYCGKYFPPNKYSIRIRIASLEGKGTGECRLYCSDGCQKACPIFNQKVYSKNDKRHKKYKKVSSREVDPLIRQMCLERDDYTCQRCEKTIDEIELHAHHIEGAVQMPMLAHDVDNTITLCKPCHKWVHRQKGCTYNDLKCEK